MNMTEVKKLRFFYALILISLLYEATHYNQWTKSKFVGEKRT